jgi:hypothetical protein
MILAISVLLSLALRISSGFDRPAVPAFAFRKPLKKNRYNH